MEDLNTGQVNANIHDEDKPIVTWLPSGNPQRETDIGGNFLTRDRIYLRNKRESDRIASRGAIG
jgi:hypothetical protein